MGLTKWIRESELRQNLTTPVLTLLIAMAAWIWPLSVLIIIIAQVTYALTKNARQQQKTTILSHPIKSFELSLWCFVVWAWGSQLAVIHRRSSTELWPHQRPRLPRLIHPYQSECVTGSGGATGREGSCAHASTVNMLHWQNEFDLARTWRSKYSGGEYASRLRERLDREGSNNAYTEQANLALLDYAHETRRGGCHLVEALARMHLCGWVEINGRTHAVVLDNNFPERFEYTKKSISHDSGELWRLYGLTVLGDPPSPPPFRSYEPVQLF